MKKLDRELGLLSVISISLGAMLGPGIFVLPGLAASIGGPGLFYAYIVGGLIILPAALSKAEMSTAIPESGGPYLFLDRTLGPLAGTVSGLGTWLSLILKAAFSLFGISLYLAFLTDFPLDYAYFIGAGIGAGLVALNSFGAKKAGQIQNVFVAGTIVILVLFFLRGCIDINRSNFRPLFPGGATGFFVATGFIAVSYVGVIKVVSVAEEIREPARNIPWGIVISMVVAVFLYSVVTYVLIGVVPFQELGKGDSKYVPLIRASEQIAGPVGRYLVGGIGVLAMTSMANAGLMAASRFPLPMAREKILPEILGTISQRFSTPVYSILLTGSLLISFVLFLPVIDIAKLASVFLLVLFTMANVAVLIFRESDAEWYRPKFKSPFYPYMHLAGAVGSTVLLVFLCWIPKMGYTPLAGTLVLIGLCVSWYYLYVREKADRWGMLFSEEEDLDEFRIFQQARQQRETWKESVIVPFFELDEITMSVERRIRLAASLCVGDERLDVVYFQEVPEQSFLSSFQSDDEIFRGLRERVRIIRNELDRDIYVDEVITHDSKKALQSYAEEEHPHWIIMDWDEPTFFTRLFSREQWWVEMVPCDVLLFLDRDEIELSDILVLTEPGPFDGEMIFATNQIARFFDGKVTYLLPTSEEDDQEFLDEYEQALRGMAEEPSVERVEPDQWKEALIERTTEANLFLFGGKKESSFSRFPSMDLLMDVAARSDCSVGRIQSSLKSPKTVLPVSGSTEVQLKKYLSADRILTDMEVSNKEELFHQLASLFATAELPAEKVKGALQERESMGNTQIGNGVALPHAIVETGSLTKVVIAHLSSPIEYSEEGVRVQYIAATVGPTSERHLHLDIIAKLSELFLDINPEEVFAPEKSNEDIARHLRERADS